MALAHEDAPRSSMGTHARKSEPRHHGRIPLAEVVPIRPAAASQDSVGAVMTRIAAGIRLPAPPGGAGGLSPSATVVA